MANEVSKIKLPNDTTEYPLQDDQAIASITRSGTTFTATRRDGTSFTFTQQDNNTTYTFATGDNNGQIKVTPSGGTAQNVSVKGLGAAAYKGTTTSVTSGSSDLVTSGAVYTAIDNLPEPMVFKGSLGTGGTITTLPTASSANEGYTYKVITAGTYASQPAKVGDLFISNGTDWIWIPSGDEPSGTVTSITLKATSPIAIDSSSAITTSGTRTLSHANSGVTAGTYRSVTVNATGHVTAGTNPTTLSGYGITDAKIANGVITLGSNTITPLTSHQTVTDNNPTLAWGTKSKVATIGSTAINVTMPSNPNTDTKVTAVGNHYTPAEDSTAQLDADASSTTAATWNSTSLVTGITVKRDAKGHVTGIAVDSIKMPANPNTNTTYTIGTSGNNITLTPSSGNAQSITAPYATSAGSATKATQDGSGNTITSTYVKKSGDTITGELKIYREGTTTQNLGAYLTFQNKDTTTGKTSNGYIVGYNGGEYGLNMVLTPGGNMFIGSGEAAQNHYNLYTHHDGESFFATADTDMLLQSNGQTIANRVGIAITTDHALIPIKADVGTNNIGSIGTSSYKWANGYFTNINGVAVGDSPKFTDTNTTYTLGTSGNTVTLTPSSGSVQSITVPYATSAGSATSASKLGSSNVGSATQPIYLNAGTATACTYSLGKSVPSDAKFTDTTYSAGTGLSLSGTSFSVNNSTITPYEAKLQWGGKDFSADYGCIDAAMVNELGANRLMFTPGSAVTIEYSRDNGSTWTDYGASNTDKTALFSSGANFYIGKADSSNKATAHGGKYQLRVTIDTGAASIYTVLNKLVIYVSTNGSAGCKVKIQKALQSTPTTFVDHKDWTSISGWSGYNVLNIASLTTYGNNAGSQYGRIRFIFADGTGGNTSYTGLHVDKIMGFGGVGWNTPSTMARTGHLYSFDASQNATFPAQVTATKFNGALSGNATSATTSKYLTVSRVAKDSQSLPGANKCIVEEYSRGTNYNLPSNAFYHIYSSQGNDTHYGCQLALGMETEAAYYRVYNNQSWGNWKSIINTNTTYTLGTSGNNVTLTPSSGSAQSITVPYATSAGNASTISNFRVSTTSSLGIAVAYNAIGYVSGLTSSLWNYNRTDGALYTQRYSNNWQHEIYGDYPTGRISVRGRNNGTWEEWKRVIVDEVLTNQDLDDVTIPGFYRAAGDNTVTNTPVTAGAAFGLIVVHAAVGSYYYQIFNHAGTNNTWRRSCNNGTWSAWVSENISNTDVNVKVNNTNPTTGTWYYPVWYTATSGTGNVNANDGFLYYSIQGTASATGRSILRLGNGTQTGTAGNKYGEIRICSQKQGYSTLTMASGATAERKHTLPDVAGTIGVFTATPTSGQVVVSDGTAGGFKTTGYTIAKSVPSNAVFTDTNTKVTQTNDSSTNSYFRLLMSGTADDTTRDDTSRKSLYLRYNPNTKSLLLGNGDVLKVVCGESDQTTSIYGGYYEAIHIYQKASTGADSYIQSHHNFNMGAHTLSNGTISSMTYTEGVTNTTGYIMHGRDTNQQYSCQWASSKLNFYVGTTNVGNVSDRQLKSEIDEIDPRLMEAIAECRIYQYKAFNRDGLISVGIIAQDLVEKCEEKGIRPENYELLTKMNFIQGDDTLYYSVDYNQYATLMIDYLQKKVKELEEKIK